MDSNTLLLTRRQALMLGALAPLLPLGSGCRASLPPWRAQDTDDLGVTLLRESATAHGLDAFSAVGDVNVSYDGTWRHLVRVLQPALVDAGYRGRSQERLLLREGLSAQAYRGPKGAKQVLRAHPAAGDGSVKVWFNEQQTQDRDSLDAAALVADAYALFLLGPLLLVSNNFPRRDLKTNLAEPASVKQAGQAHLCDVLNMTLTPGFGNAASDRAALYIDRETRLMRRARITLNGLQSTQGALVDIDMFDHQSLFGVQWPTGFHEKLLRPGPLDVHHWRLTGLDVNRNETAADFAGMIFSDKAIAPAELLVL